MLKDASGNLLNGVVGAIFAVYSEQTGGIPLWQETRNVRCSQGRYTVVLGESTVEGIPEDVFASGQPRWLGIRLLMPGGTNRSFIRHEAGGTWSTWVEQLSPDNSGNQGFNGNTILPATLTGYHGTSGTKVQLSDGTGTSGIEAVFASDGSVTNSTAGMANQATCWKAAGKIGYCSSGVSNLGTCTCN